MNLSCHIANPKMALMNPYAKINRTPPILEKTASVVIEVEKETASERERDKRAKRERERMAIVNEGKKNDQLCGG